MKRISICILLLLLSAMVIHSQAKSFEEKAHLTLGAGVAYNVVGGDFDGDSALVGSGQVIALPAFDYTMGYRAQIGIEQAGSGVAISLTTVTHPGTWLGAPIEATFDVWGFDIVNQIPIPSLIRPAFYFGSFLATLRISDGAYDGIDFEDAVFTSFGLQGGAGIVLVPVKRLRVSGQALYRWLKFDGVRGVGGGTLTITDGIKAGGWDMCVVAELLL